jgi:hypothetical protein
LADLSFEVAPILLADALHNAVVLAQDSGGGPGCPHVLVCYQQDAGVATGAVLVYGASRLIAGRTTIRLDTLAPEDHASICISREHADQIQSVLRGFGRAKATRVGVRICEEGYDTVDFDEGEPLVKTVHFSVRKGEEEHIAELADSDPSREYSRHFDIVDDYLIGAGAPLLAPTLLSFEALKRVLNLKGLGATAVDIAWTKREHILRVSAGPNFRGILGELDREVYAGPDGARADHLL